MSAQYINVGPPIPRKPSALKNFSNTIGESLQMENQRQEQMKQLAQENEAIKQNFGIDLTGINDPKQRQNIVQQMQQSQNQIQKLSLENQFKNQIQNQKQAQENQEKVAPLDSALQTVNDMRNIRKKGNLGRASSITGFFGGETAKDRGEYVTLGNSLIQHASSIPIRNKAEFEKLAGKLSDPSITDDEAEGVLNAMESLINRSLEGFSSQGEQPKKNKKSKKPLADIFG